MIEAALGVLETVALYVGYVVIGIVVFCLLADWWWEQYAARDVSDQAREIAEQANPNNNIPNELGAMVVQGVLDGIHELQPDEALKSDPEPVTHFDWSIKSRDSRQEHIEHILETLARAGYHVQPLPTTDHYNDRTDWSREIAGVWLGEPDWQIVSYDEDGSREVVKEVEVDVPSSWTPEAKQIEA